MPNPGDNNTEFPNGGAQGATENQDDDLDKGTGADPDELPDDVDELKEIVVKTRTTRDKNYARMKEAQGFEKDEATGKWVKKEKPAAPKPASQQPAGGGQENTDNFSTKDTMALMGAGITEEEDIDKVAKYAKLEGITIRDALKAPIVKAVLADSAEKRRTANATNTGKTRTGDTKKSGEVLLEKASKTGVLPDDPEDMTKLAEQQLDQMTK